MHPLGGNRTIFRQEALDQQSRGFADGAILRSTPLWLRWTHWFSMICLIVGLLFLLIVRVNGYASGPAVIRARVRSSLLAQSDGVVQFVRVSAGEQVRTGDLLVHLSGEHVPGSPGNLEEDLRAPVGGILSDLRVKTGDRVIAGEPLLDIVGETSDFEMVALLPAQYGTLLHTGTVIELKLDGYPESHARSFVQHVDPNPIDHIGVVRLGFREREDVAPTRAPRLAVYSVVGQAEFGATGEQFLLRDGMTGTVQVKVESEPMILSLIPGLRHLVAGIR
jgi:membrane fusion protein (multidrug efflux system)